MIHPDPMRDFSAPLALESAGGCPLRESKAKCLEVRRREFGPAPLGNAISLQCLCQWVDKKGKIDSPETRDLPMKIMGVSCNLSQQNQSIDFGIHSSYIIHYD